MGLEHQLRGTFCHFWVLRKDDEQKAERGRQRRSIQAGPHTQGPEMEVGSLVPMQFVAEKQAQASLPC